jgi:hypothetical protein
VYSAATALNNSLRARASLFILEVLTIDVLLSNNIWNLNQKRVERLSEQPNQDR